MLLQRSLRAALRQAPQACRRAIRSAPTSAAAAKAPAFAVGTGASAAATQASVGLPPAVALALGLSGAAVATTTNCEGDYLRRNFVADAAAKALPAVVNLTSDVQKGWVRGMSAGSGFIVRADGLVVTNAHVVQHARGGKVVVTLADGRKLRGRVLALDAASDLAVVQCEVPKHSGRARELRSSTAGRLLDCVGEAFAQLPVAELGSSASLRPGDFVVALGSPLNLSNSVTSGIVSNVHRHGSELGNVQSRAEYLQTDAAINQGNSGGPLVDLDGKVVGINTMKAAAADGISFAIPIDVAWAVVRQLLQHGAVKRPYVGIQMRALPLKGGVEVVQVAPDSPAERAGLRAGDRLVAMRGERIRDVADVLARLALRADVLDVTVARPDVDGSYRNATLVEARVVPEER